MADIDLNILPYRSKLQRFAFPPAQRFEVVPPHTVVNSEMKKTRYIVPESAPIWVKNILIGSPSPGSIQALIVLSLAVAAVVAWVERGGYAALLSLVFVWYALVAWLALRWGKRNALFRDDSI